MSTSDAKAIKRHTAQYDLFNRIHSIAYDQAFVDKVAQGWYDGRFEVVPMRELVLRSVRTYAYFKSTDGHTNNWQFNLRRSNLPLASHIDHTGGIILVDSTRRGKRMPDALSKTVPIWCAVVNLAVKMQRMSSTSTAEWDTKLYLPAGVVSPSEKAQIEAMIPTWVGSLLTSNLPLPNITKPLRPFFLHPSTSQPPAISAESDFTPVICLSASRWVGVTGQSGINAGDEVPSVTRLQGRAVGYEYVPGAGDDDEAWGRGLKPALFWRHRTTLLNTSKEDLADQVDQLVSLARGSPHVLEEGVHQLQLSASASQSRGLPGASGPALGDNVQATSVPLPSSRLGLALGPPVLSPSGVDVRDRPRAIIHVCEVPKAAAYPETVYHTKDSRIDPAQDSHSYIAIPSPKSDSKGYYESLHKLVAAVREFSARYHRVELRPCQVTSLDKVRNSQAREMVEAGGMNAEDDHHLDVPLSEQDIVAARKVIIPLALLLLLAIPKLGDQETREGDTEAARTGSSPKLITKGDIAHTLHQLVSLWPDGNPPRVALKRVNEYLMSQERV